MSELQKIDFEELLVLEHDYSLKTKTEYFDLGNKLKEDEVVKCCYANNPSITETGEMEKFFYVVITNFRILWIKPDYAVYWKWPYEAVFLVIALGDLVTALVTQELEIRTYSEKGKQRKEKPAVSAIAPNDTKYLVAGVGSDISQEVAELLASEIHEAIGDYEKTYEIPFHPYPPKVGPYAELEDYKGIFTKPMP